MGVLEDIREQYPSLAWLTKDPEVGKLLRDAVDPNKGFSPTTFQAKLYQTKWFKSRSTAQRQYDILKHTDPAEFQRQRQTYYAETKRILSNLGLSLKTNELKYLAETNYRNGVATGSEQFTLNLMNLSKAFGEKRFSGSGSVQGSKLAVKSMAKQQYFIPMTDKEATDWGIDMALGLKDENALKAALSKKSASLYPHLKELLNGGASMDDIFSGHRALIAQELELSPETIDFTKDYKKVLYQVDPQTQKPRPMTLHETQTLARQDNRWWDTAGGRKADAGMANTMLKMFGKRA